MLFDVETRPSGYGNHIDLHIMYDINLPPLSDRIIMSVVNSNGIRIKMRLVTRL